MDAAEAIERAIAIGDRSRVVLIAASTELARLRKIEAAIRAVHAARGAAQIEERRAALRVALGLEA